MPSGNAALRCRARLWEGSTDSQIAERLGCVPRTVERKVLRIRAKWARLLKASRSP